MSPLNTQDLQVTPFTGIDLSGIIVTCADNVAIGSQAKAFCDSVLIPGNSIVSNTAVASTNTSPTGNNMTFNSSFVSDKFVKVDGASHPLYQRMTEKELSGAELHPLLKTVIKEANSLEQEKKDLLKKIDDIKADLNTALNQLSTVSSDQDRINDLEHQKRLLEKCLVNQEASLDTLQDTLAELADAHAALQRRHFDYSEESVNQIVEDYQAQLALYEALLSDNEIAHAQLEIRNARADFANRIAPFVSMKWIRKNIFKLSDEDIAEIELQVANETAGITQEQVDKMIETAKLDMLAKQDSSVSHEEKFMELGPGVKVWQATTGRGPFLTQVLKPYVHKDKQATTSIGWLVRNEKGREEHFPIGDLTTKEPVRNGPNKFAHLAVGAVNAVAMQLIGVQALGLKAVVPMAIAQTLMAAFTYRDVFKATK